MHAATKDVNPDILSLLLEHDVDVDSRDGNDATSLHWASVRGTLSVGQYLLDHGADINARDKDGCTPMYVGMYYSLKGVEFAQMLLECGAVVDAQDNDGRTSLHRAVGMGKIEGARLLLEQCRCQRARQIRRDRFPVHDETGYFRTTFSVWC